MEDGLGLVIAVAGTGLFIFAVILLIREIIQEDKGHWSNKWKDTNSLYPYMSTSFVMVEKPSDGSRTPYYIEDMMHGTGYHRAINVYTGKEELIRESNVIEVL